MKNWLKGGLIGVGIWLVLTIFNIYCMQTCRGEGCLGCAIPLFPLLILGYKLGIMDIHNNVSSLLAYGSHLFYLPLYFGIGAIIGWIVQKVKK